MDTIKAAAGDIATMAVVVVACSDRNVRLGRNVHHEELELSSDSDSRSRQAMSFHRDTAGRNLPQILQDQMVE